MRQLNGDDGVGALYEDLDGNLYEWVEGYERVDGIDGIEGVDEWGEVSACAQCVGDSRELEGLGALYEAPDGTMYQVHGLSEEEAAAEAEAEASESPGSEEADSAPRMAPGKPGQIRVGPGGHRYRWVRGVNAQGKPTGFWRRLRPSGPSTRPSAARSKQGGARRMRARPAPRGRGGPRRKGGFLKKLLPIAKLATRFIPVPGAGAAVRAGLTVASKLMKPRGVADDGLGALYAAPDGTVYQMQGFADDEVHGIDADEQVDGYAGYNQSFADDFAGPDDLDGFAAPSTHTSSEYPTILSADDGDVGATDPNALEGYLREQPPRTRWVTESTHAPAPWKPYW
jgi:hypothetical protein